MQACTLTVIDRLRQHPTDELGAQMTDHLDSVDLAREASELAELRLADIRRDLEILARDIAMRAAKRPPAA
jgi:hypothetical protein